MKNGRDVMVPQVQADTTDTYERKRQSSPPTAKGQLQVQMGMDRVGKVPVITNSVRQELLMDEPNFGIQV